MPGFWMLRGCGMVKGRLTGMKSCGSRETYRLVRLVAYPDTRYYLHGQETGYYLDHCRDNLYPELLRCIEMEPA